MKCCFYLKYLEAGDVEHTDEVLFLVFRLQRVVDALNEPHEHPSVDGLRDRLHRELNLRFRLTFGDILIADLDPRGQERSDKVTGVQAQQVCSLFRL